jgi:hypothetical protein
MTNTRFGDLVSALVVVTVVNVLFGFAPGPLDTLFSVACSYGVFRLMDFLARRLAAKFGYA